MISRVCVLWWIFGCFWGFLRGILRLKDVSFFVLFINKFN